MGSLAFNAVKSGKRYRVIFVAMNVQKEYKRGGFFGNSQDKFSDMEGAGKGINMSFGSRGILGGNLGGKGRALRREKRYLKKLERQGKLNEYGPQSGDRLDYLRKVQKDRAKKGVAGYLGANALIAGAILGGPALAAKFGGKALLKGGAKAGVKAGTKAGAKGGFKGLMDLFGKARKAKSNLESIRGLAEGLSPEQQEQIDTGNFSDDPSMNPYGFEMGGKIDEFDGPYGDNGFRILRKAGGMAFGGNRSDDTAGGLQSKRPDLKDIDRQERMDMLKDSMPGSLLPAMRVMKQGGLVGGQKRLDKNNDGKISREDFELLRAMFGAKIPR